MLNKDIATQILIKHYIKQRQKYNILELRFRFDHKIRHTFNVLSATQRIIFHDQKLNKTSNEQKDIYEIGAIFHDIGRFYQNNGKEIVSDNIVDHGLMGYNILKKEGIENLSLKLAVKHHNKYSIQSLEEDSQFKNLKNNIKNETVDLLKIIRDADKLENIENMIYKPIIKFTEIESKLSGNQIQNGGISPEILDSFMSKKQILKKHRKTYIDHRVYWFSRVFDINFNGTKQILKNSGLLNLVKNKFQEFKINQDIIQNSLKVIDETLSSK